MPVRSPVGDAGARTEASPLEARVRSGTDRWARTLALVLLTAALAWHGLRPLVDLDLWWHMRLGEQMLATGSLVPTDIFSHTRAGAPWPWKDAGSAVLLYALWSLGGSGTIVIFKAALLLGTAVVLWVTLHRVRKVPWALALLAVALATDAASFRFTERAATISLLLAAVVVLLVERHRRGASTLVWAIPLTILNANLHRAALLLPVLIGTLAAVEMVETFLLGRARPWRRSTLVAIGSALGCLCTPFGTAIATTTWTLMGRHHALITEWAPVEVGLLWALTPASLAVIGLVAVGGVLRLVQRERDLWDAALAGLMLVVGLGSMRHLPYLALVGIGPAASALARLTPAFEGSLRRVMAVSGALAALAAQVTRPFPGPSLGLTPAHFAERGVAFVKELPEALRIVGPMFNEFGYGGFLIHHLWPEHRVYIDGRTDLVYPVEMIERYGRALSDPRAFAQEVERYGIEWVFLDMAPQRRALAFLDADPRWVLVHVSRRALIYVRRDGPNAALARSHGYELVAPHDLQGSVQRALAAGRAVELRRELQRMLAEDPDNIYAEATLSVLDELAPP